MAHLRLAGFKLRLDQHHQLTRGRQAVADRIHHFEHCTDMSWGKARGQGRILYSGVWLPQQQHAACTLQLSQKNSQPPKMNTKEVSRGHSEGRRNMQHHGQAL